MRKFVLGKMGGMGALVLAVMAIAAFGAVGTLRADPPSGQAYTGAKRCASCHFDQFMKWKKTGHATAFLTLTAKYQQDEKCLVCHTTGYGVVTGFKDVESTPALAGITCEVCHGPGSKHEEIAQPFAKVKTLTPEQEKAIRGSIWRMIPKNICVECHKMQGHKDSPTPPEMRKKK
jgi:hypothetical protein